MYKHFVLALTNYHEFRFVYLKDQNVSITCNSNLLLTEVAFTYMTVCVFPMNLQFSFRVMYALVNMSANCWKILLIPFRRKEYYFFSPNAAQK